MSRKIICGIYKITSPSGRIYIGKSKDCLRRKLSYGYNQIKNQIIVYASIQKHGWDKHKFEIIHECLLEEIDFWEIHYISFYKSFGTSFGMNLNVGGGGNNGWKPSSETKQRIGAGNRGKIRSPETRELIRNTLSGVKHTDERKENIRKSLTGRKATDKHKKNMSIAMTGKKLRKWSAESVANRIKNHPNRKPVLNLQTGIYYIDCKEAADSIGWNYKTLRGQLLGNARNRTDFIYV